MGSGVDGGGNVGVVAADSCCLEAAVGRWDDLDLDGLGSWTLFFRELLDVAVTDGRVGLGVDFPCVLAGEVSLDARGEAVREVFVDVHFDCCVSRLASWSTEFRLETLASKPAVLALFGKVPDLSMLAGVGVGSGTGKGSAITAGVSGTSATTPKVYFSSTIGCSWVEGG